MLSAHVLIWTWLLDTWSISADLSPASTATDISDLLVVASCRFRKSEMTTYGRCSFGHVNQGRRRRYGRTNNPTDNV